MKKWKQATSILLGAAMAAGLTACGGGSAKETSAEAKQDATSAAAVEASSAEESASSEEPVTIRLVHYMGEQTKRDALDEMLAVFKESHPNITVDIENVNSSSYIATYKNYIAAGEAPDIMFGKPQTMTEFVEAGYFKDIKDWECFENTLDVLKDECTLNGGVYGFPIDGQVKAVFYNKDMFEEYGLEVPTTRDEFFKVCDTFMEAGIYPMVHPYNFIHGVFHEMDAFFTSMAAATGNEQVWLKSQNGEANLVDNPIVADAFEMFSKMASYKDAGDSAVDQAQEIQNFAAGQRPMYINGGWLMGDVLAASPDGNFGMFPLPWSDNPEDAKLWIGIDDVFIVSETTEHEAEVRELLNFFATDEASEIWMKTAKLMSSNTNVSTDDADAFIQEIKSYIDSGKIVPKGLVPDYTSEFSTAFRTKLQYFVTLDDSERDVPSLIKEIDAEMETIRE